ncbi:MAG: glutathione S-transferase family protein [Parvularculaceae bacterium]
MADPVRIYGLPLSQNVRKPLSVAHHLGIEVENDPLRPNEEGVVAVNPCGRIPAMDDNGYLLGESNAIMIHLARKVPNNLYPADPKLCDRVNFFLFWDVAHWTPAYQPIQFERVVKRAFDLGECDEAAVEAAMVKLTREATFLNNYLEGREWLVGDAPTLADFAVGCGLTHAEGMDLPLRDYPNILAWNARVKNLDGMKKTAI